MRKISEGSWSSKRIGSQFNEPMLKLTKSQSSKTLVFRTTPTKMITDYTIILLDSNTWLNVLFVTVTVALTTPKEVKTCQCINKSLLRYHYNCPHYFPMRVHPVTDDTATPPPLSPIRENSTELILDLLTQLFQILKFVFFFYDFIQGHKFISPSLLLATLS